jgi:hypothetical protein
MGSQKRTQHTQNMHSNKTHTEVSCSSSICQIMSHSSAGTVAVQEHTTAAHSTPQLGTTSVTKHSAPSTGKHTWYEAQQPSEIPSLNNQFSKYNRTM